MPDDDGTWGVDFEIRGKKLPPDVVEKFMQATALLTGVKGHVEQAQAGVYKGYLEGEKVVLEKFKDFVEKAEVFKGVVEQTVFKTMKSIKESTVTTFDVRIK